MKIQVDLFDTEGEVIGQEEIEVTEYEVKESYEGDFRFSYKQLIELSDYTKACKDDVIAKLDEIYGYFKYQII